MHQIEVIIIAALCKTNRVIGLDGTMPWPNIKEDLKRFRALTMGSPILMGRSTYEAVGALPDRTNIICSKTLGPQLGAYVCNSLSSAINKARDISDTGKVFIAGGADIYNQTIQKADRLELTVLDKEYVGDTVFPVLPEDMYKLVNTERQYEFVYETYIRKSAQLK